MTIKARWAELLIKGGAEERGISLLKESARSGDSHAALALLDLVQEDDKQEDIVQLLRECAQKGGTGVFLELADLLSESPGSAGEAEEWYKEALKMNLPGTLNNYGCFLLDQERTEEAEKMLRAAAEEGDALALGNLGKHYFDLDNYTDALTYLTKASENGNSRATAYLARTHMELGNQAEADRWVTISLAQDHAGAHLAHALFLSRFPDQVEHKKESIEGEFKAAVEESPEAHFYYANWLNSMGRKLDAVTEYQKSIAAGEENAYLNIAITLDDLGSKEEAEHYLRAGVESGDPTSAASLARFLADEDRLDEVPAVIREADRLGCPALEVAELWIMHQNMIDEDDDEEID
ncbi:hypothetical protein [Streptomyces sp. enrichment culture]|uniref:hypothetical protein n=1 Tax=Streptomyces sp. enrichment culture TaxID=1795815 RepID=UPI003F5441D8